MMAPFKMSRFKWAAECVF